MKLKRPLSANQMALMTVGALAVLYWLKVETMRWIEVKRIRGASTYSFPSRELAELDHLLQVRFAVRPTNDFGMARIGARHEIFKPLSDGEREAIASLRRQKMDVVFYVASRDHLLGKSAFERVYHPLQGPVFMTKEPPLRVKATQTFYKTTLGNTYPNPPTFQTENRPVDLPSEAQLNASLGLMLISHSKYDHTATSDGKTYRAGSWQVAAVPVRATDQFCINCHFYFSHPCPRLGDPLGIALYAFRPTGGHQIKTKTVVLPPAFPSLRKYE